MDERDYIALNKELQKNNNKSMNILTFEDVENYLKFKQVYFKIEVCDSGFQTNFKANRVYDLQNITCSKVRENTYYLHIECNGINKAIYKECTKPEFFAWIKVNFIPIPELIEYCNQIF